MYSENCVFRARQATIIKCVMGDQTHTNETETFWHVQYITQEICAGLSCFIVSNDNALWIKVISLSIIFQVSSRSLHNTIILM